jgi:hypothetical protein
MKHRRTPRSKRTRRFEVLCTQDEYDLITLRGTQATGNARKVKAWARTTLIGRKTPSATGNVPRARVIAFAEQVHRWAACGDTEKITRLADTVLGALRLTTTAE